MGNVLQFRNMANVDEYEPLHEESDFDNPIMFLVGRDGTIEACGANSFRLPEWIWMGMIGKKLEQLILNKDAVERFQSSIVVVLNGTEKLIRYEDTLECALGPLQLDILVAPDTPKTVAVYLSPLQEAI